MQTLTLHAIIVSLPSCSRCFAGAGGPWEFNLRDLLRWCQLAESAVPTQPPQQQHQAMAGAEGDAPSLGSGEATALDAAVQHYASLLFLQRLRTSADRRHAATVFAEAWQQEQGQEGLPAWQQQRQQGHPELHISPTALQVGWATLPRASSIAAAAAVGGGTVDAEGAVPTSSMATAAMAAAAQPLALLPSQLPALESVAECAARGWMCLLVGPAASGKTAAVRSLAQLCGQPLLELSLTSGTDTSDLLGGFEQVEPARKVQVRVPLPDAACASASANRQC